MIASRTPADFPARCPLCEASTNFAVGTLNAGVQDQGVRDDAMCPACGCLILFSTGILRRIQDCFSRTSALPRPISAQDPFLESFQWDIDSLEVIKLVMEIEEAFDVQIPDDGVESMRTWGDFVRAVDRAYRRQRE